MSNVSELRCVCNESTNSDDDGSEIFSNLTEWDRLILENKIRPLTPGGYLAIGIYLVIIGLLATIGNGVMLTVFRRNRKLLKNPHNYLLLNLVISDLGISIFGYPWTTSSSFAGRYLYGNTMCVIQGFLTFTFAQTDMNTLACLAFYRYIVVCMPGDAHRLTTSLTSRVIAFLWIYSLLWTVPPLIGWSAYTYEPFGTSCSIDWDDSETGAVAYTWCLVLYCFVIHIFIMCFCYYYIAVKAREIHYKLKHFTIGGINNKDTHCMRRINMERKATLMSIGLTVTFVILWSPYVFVCLWSVYDNELPNWITTWPTMFAKLSCTLNPILYFMTNPSFRRNIGTIFRQPQESQGASFELQPLGRGRFAANDKTEDGVYKGIQLHFTRPPKPAQYK